MKKSGVIKLSLLLLFGGGCKKRDYPQEQVFNGEEKFYFEATIDNATVNLKAGQDGYVLFTSVDRGTDSVYIFSGELKKNNCDPCPNSLRFDITDYKIRVAGAAAEPDSVFVPGSKLYIAPALVNTPTFTFTSLFNRSASAWDWDFGDGKNSQLRNPEHTYQTPGKFKVGVKITSDNGCVNSALNTLHIFNDGTYFFSGINVTSTGEKSASFISLHTGGVEPFSYQWHFGDGSTSEEKDPVHQYQWPGGYPVKLIVTDGAGRQVVSEYNYVTGNDQSSCAANFSMSHRSTVNHSFKTLKFAWTDGSNRIFRSDLVEQTPESSFEILSVEDFEPNEAGDPTLLLTVRINVLVSDGNEIKKVTCQKAVLGVAYK